MGRIEDLASDENLYCTLEAFHKGLGDRLRYILARGEEYVRHLEVIDAMKTCETTDWLIAILNSGRRSVYIDDLVNNDDVDVFDDDYIAYVNELDDTFGFSQNKVQLGVRLRRAVDKYRAIHK